MVCPFCLSNKTEVYNSRRTKKINSVWRRRRCPHCEREFTTEEQVRPETIMKVGIKGLPRALPYSRTKLLLAIYKACDHRKQAAAASEHVLATVEQRLYKIAAAQDHTVTKENITQTTLDVLKNYDAAAYIKYLSYHQPGLDNATVKRQLRVK